MGRNKKTVQNDNPAANASGPVSENTSGEIRLAILAKPGARVSRITGIEEEGIGVQIAAKPVDGEANSELISFISHVLDIKKTQVSLDKGSKSRQKILIITTPQLKADQVLEKLKSAVDQ